MTSRKRVIGHGVKQDAEREPGTVMSLYIQEQDILQYLTLSTYNEGGATTFVL